MSGNDYSDRPLLERLEALAAYLPQFEDPGFEFGQWSHPPQNKPGVIVVGHYSQSDTAVSLVRTAYEMGWVMTDFDWPNWKGTDEAIRLRDDPAALTAATPDQLARLLTVLIRQDRYVDGALGSAYKSGLLTAILRRAAVLAEELRGQSE